MKLRGVNLGGWLVLERWMTPALFDGTDAIDEHSLLHTKDAAKRLRHHHKTFIQEEDFRWMQANGINAIRIPVGYWIFEGDGPYIPSISRLDWVFLMAKKYQIQVLICLHGAPGSQNGRDHSGRVGRANWYRSAEYRTETIACLEKLARRYRDHPQLWGIELLNEPKIGILQWKLRRFYNQAYRRLITILHPRTKIVFHDAFTPRMLSAAIWESPVHPVVMDIHWYHFGFILHKWLPLRYYWKLVVWHGYLAQRLQRWQGVIIGEFSSVLSHESLRRYPEELHAGLLADHLARQLVAYRHADGWFYWTYKTQDRGAWNFRSLVEDGMLPSDWME
jgi:glucan 1,3-beta-glucosidase